MDGFANLHSKVQRWLVTSWIGLGWGAVQIVAKLHSYGTQLSEAGSFTLALTMERYRRRSLTALWVGEPA